MTKRLFLSCIALSLICSTGCLFSRKDRKPKENPAIASEVEESYRRRWVDRRADELVAQGVAAEAARAQAAREFDEKFDFNKSPQK